MRVLIIKMSSMGDVIHTLPAVHDALKALPHVEFHWVVEKTFSEIPAWCTRVTKVIPVEIRKWRGNIFSAFTWESFKFFWHKLREEHYDLIIDAQGLFKSAVIAYFAKGPTCGYSWHSARESYASLFYKKRVICDYQQHAITRIRKLFSNALSYPTPDLDKIDYGLLQRYRTEKNARPEKYILFFHGSSGANKLWTTENWIQLGRLLQGKQYHIVLPWGNHEEYLTACHIARYLRPGYTSVLTKLNLNELKNHIFYARACVSVDTGLAHLTAAIDKTNFVLYMETDPTLIGTRGLRQHHIKATSLSGKKLFQKIISTLEDSKSYLKKVEYSE